MKNRKIKHVIKEVTIMDRTYIGFLKIKDIRYEGDVLNELVLILCRNNFEITEKKQYDFQKLIEGYDGLDAHIKKLAEDYVISLFSKEEIETIKSYFNGLGFKGFSYREESFPISPFNMPEGIFWEKVVRGSYVFNTLNAIGYFDVRWCRIYERKVHDTLPEKILKVNQMIDDFQFKLRHRIAGEDEEINRPFLFELLKDDSGYHDPDTDTGM